METEMAGMNENAVLQELEDKEALRAVVTKFARALDRADADLLASTLANDAQVSYGGFEGKGSDFVTQRLTPAGLERSFHSISNEYFQLSGDLAKGEVYVITVSTWAPAGQDKIDTLIGGRYIDEYSKASGEWKITKRTFVHEWNMTFPNTTVWDEGLFGQIKLRGLRSKEDPIYTVLGA
jgi:hypothetical protein